MLPDIDLDADEDDGAVGDELADDNRGGHQAPGGHEVPIVGSLREQGGQIVERLGEHVGDGW